MSSESDDDYSSPDEEYDSLITLSAERPIARVNPERILSLLNGSRNVSPSSDDNVEYIHYTFTECPISPAFFVYDKRYYKDFFLKHYGEFRNDYYPSGVMIEGDEGEFDDFMCVYT